MNTKYRILPLLFVMLHLPPAMPISGQVPALINYQGRLTDSLGNPVSGNRTMEVRIYNEPTGGQLVYQEVIGTVTVSNGLYSFRFGSAVNDLAALLSGHDYLALRVNGIEESVRMRLLAVPYALKAKESEDAIALGEEVAEASGQLSALMAEFRVPEVIGNLSLENPAAGSTFTIKNNGFGRLKVSSVGFPEGFSGNWSGGSIGPGGERTISISYDHTSPLPVSYNSSIRLVSDATDGNGSISLSFTVPGSLVEVRSGRLPLSSSLSGVAVETFQLSRLEVTLSEWQRVSLWALENGYDLYPESATGAGGNHPARKVSWHDAVKWCNAKSQMEGLSPVYKTAGGAIYKTGRIVPTVDLFASGYRLPSEAEWEWAARGGVLSQNFKYSGGNSIEDIGWFLDNTDDSTRPVGSKSANEIGLLDMSGNVWEWVFDASGSNRRLRGGSFAMSSAFCTVGYAANWPPYSRFNDGGFRVARNAERFATVWGGTLPQSSPNAGEVVETFQIARFEVTRAEWDAVRAWAVANGYGDLGNVGSGADGNHPVRKVGWYDAVKWCNAKSEMEGLAPVYQLPGGGVYRTGQVSPVANGAANGYRLPTRVEWEWAARGGLSSRGFTYSGGNNLDAVGWYFSNTNDLTEPVGAKVPNELGLYDMSGNVWEWVFEASGTNRLLRGGSFAMEDEFCGVGYLANWSPDARYNDGGFRLARKLDELVSD